MLADETESCAVQRSHSSALGANKASMLLAAPSGSAKASNKAAFRPSETTVASGRFMVTT